MKLILILTIYSSVAFARFYPSSNSYFPGFQYQQSSGYDSHEKDSESDQKYLSKLGVSLSPSYGGYFPGPYSPSNGWSQLSGGGASDLSQYYDSHKAASEKDLSYFNSIANNGGGYYDGSSIPSLPSPTPYLPVGGSGYDINQYYNSKQAASEEDESYFLNAAGRKSNLWSPTFGYNYAPPSGSSFDINQGYDSHQAASESDQSYYLNAELRNPTWWSPSYKPNQYVIPSNVYPSPAPLGGSSFDFNQGYDSHQAASESDQSYYLNAGVRNPNWWSPSYGYRPNTFVAPPSIGSNIYSPSAPIGGNSFDSIGGGFSPNTYSPSLPVGGNSFDFSQGYDSYQAASESDQSYYLNAGVRNPNWWSPSYGYRPNTYVPPSTIGGPNIYAPLVSGGGNSLDINQAYDSRQAASESDESYFLNAGGRSPNWWSPGYGYRPNTYVPPSTISVPNVYAPSVSGGGNSFDINQAYDSHQAASESDESYYLNAGGRSPNRWSPGYGYRPNTYVPPSTISVPNIYPPSVSASGNSFDINQAYDSHQAASESDQSYYLNAGGRNPNWWSPSYGYRPNTFVPPSTIAVPNIGGNSFDINQAYDSHQAASESDQSYYLNAGIRNPNWWSSSYGYRPNKYITPLSIGSGYNPNIYAPSALGGGNSYGFNEGFNSHKAASESDESYFAKAGLNNPNWWSSGASYNPISGYNSFKYGPVIGGGNSFDFNQGFNSHDAASEKDESYYGKAAYNNGYPFSAGGAWWSRPQSYNIPLSNQRFVSENFRDSESQSLNDQSSFLNKYISNNLGGVSESAGSHSLSNNRDSDIAYDFKDIGKTVYGYK